MTTAVWNGVTIAESRQDSRGRRKPLLSTGFRPPKYLRPSTTTRRSRYCREATACDRLIDRLRARSSSVEELAAEQRTSRDRLLHCSDDALSVRGIALALELPQAASDHSEKVVDVVDDELRYVHNRHHPHPTACGDRATRVGPRAGVT